MAFFVIEGDNGTGKDTIASKFVADGFKVITYEKRMRAMEALAKQEKGKNRVFKFMAYNKAEGDLAREMKATNDVLLVRYFVSTLAAGYADKIFSYEDTMKMLRDTYKKFEKPDVIIRLKCDYAERINRIEKRNSSNYDDKTLKRNVRYRWITDEIKKNTDVKWIEIDTSNKTIEQIYQEINQELNKSDIDLEI